MPEDREEDLDALAPGTRLRGASVLAAALVLVLLIVWLLSGGGAEFFRAKIHLHTFLGDTGGLAKDADVLLNGVAAGKVEHVGLSNSHDPNRAIQVDLRVERRFMDAIPVDSIAALTADNLLGDKYVDITVGKADQHVVDGAEIASLVQSGSFNPADLVTSLQLTLQRVDSIVTQIQQGDTPLAQFVRGDDFYRGIESQIASVQQTIRSYAGPKTQTGRMLFSDALYNQIRQPILNLDHMLDQIQRGENPTGRFLNSPAAYENAVTQARSVHRSLADLNDGKSPNSALLKSDAQYRSLEAQIRNIDESIDRLADPKGKFGQYLESRGLYDSLTAQSSQAGVFLRDFRRNPQKFLRVKPFGSKHPKKP